MRHVSFLFFMQLSKTYSGVMRCIIRDVCHDDWKAHSSTRLHTSLTCTLDSLVPLVFHDCSTRSAEMLMSVCGL